MGRVRRTSRRMPMEQAAAATRMQETEPVNRIVTIEAVDQAWRVRAAHMEPLRFRTAAEAERAGQRVARTLSRLGFDTRLETYDEAGTLIETAPYAAETNIVDLRPPPRRLLHS